MIPQMNNKSILNYVRSKLSHLLDSSRSFVEEKGLRESCQTQHKGCFISIQTSDAKENLREGSIVPQASNILESLDTHIENLAQRLKVKNILLPHLIASQIFITIVEDCQYLADPLMWDADKDGVYFQWGDKYRGFYLPHQIKEMNLSKTAVLDRLVAWEAGLACNLWRTECGLVFRLKCVTIP